MSPPLLEASAKRILGGAQGLLYLEAFGADLHLLPNKQAPTDTAGSQSQRVRKPLPASRSAARFIPEILDGDGQTVFSSSF
jgi:hypothetical protein